MTIAFPVHIKARLEGIEALEGIPRVEVVHQAVEVWTSLTAEERQWLGFAALQIVASRMRRGGR